MSYWLMKSEPETFSIDDLAKTSNGESWDGVRNFQARNFMRSMKIGDKAFFYHSNTKVPGIVGIMSITREAYPDHTQFDPNSPYYDPKSRPDEPRWQMVDVHFESKFDQIISLSTLKASHKLEGLALLKRGNRLSILPVTHIQWSHIINHFS